jgi:hypothetical protein
MEGLSLIPGKVNGFFNFHNRSSHIMDMRLNHNPTEVSTRHFVEEKNPASA